MLDEPFGALDAFTREELWCVIRDLQAARKVTVILVTHDLREAVFLADRVFVMTPRPTLPSSSVSRVFVFCSSRSFSRSTRRESTMLPRFLLNLMTLNW